MLQRLAPSVIVLSLVQSASISAQEPPSRVALALLRAQNSDAGTDGRFAERARGSYVFAPLRVDWPQVPVLNPEIVGSLAIGPPLRVRGTIDDGGNLRVSRFDPVPRPTGSLTPAARSASRTLEQMIAGVVARDPRAMDVDTRALPVKSVDAINAQAAIKNIVDGYLALRNGDEKTRQGIVEEWVSLRSAFVDAFSDSQEAKTIYGSLDNYPPWRYDVIFRQAQSVVALGEPGQQTPFCSGVVVAPDLALTAAHCFSGPPRRIPTTVQVWFGYSELPPGSTHPEPIRKRITALVVPPPDRLKDLLAGRFDARFLDFAIVRFETGPDVAAPPQCLRRDPLNRGDAVYVLGYPQGNRVKVHDSARV